VCGLDLVVEAVTATFTLLPGPPSYGSTPAPGSTLDMGTTAVGTPR